MIIGRTAGEEQDNRLEAGSYLLSDDEIAMLTVVREHFKSCFASQCGKYHRYDRHKQNCP